MDEENKGLKVCLAIAVIIILCLWYYYGKVEKQLVEVEDILYSCENSVDEANVQIEDAQYYAWESYDEMGEALESLYTVSY